MGVSDVTLILINRTFFQICPQFNLFIHSFWGVIHNFRREGHNDSMAVTPIFSRLYAIFLCPAVQRFLDTVQIPIQQTEMLLKMRSVEFQLYAGVLPGLNMLR